MGPVCTSGPTNYTFAHDEFKHITQEKYNPKQKAMLLQYYEIPILWGGSTRKFQSIWAVNSVSLYTYEEILIQYKTLMQIL